MKPSKVLSFFWKHLQYKTYIYIKFKYLNILPAEKIKIIRGQKMP